MRKVLLRSPISQSRPCWSRECHWWLKEDVAHLVRSIQHTLSARCWALYRTRGRRDQWYLEKQSKRDEGERFRRKIRLNSWLSLSQNQVLTSYGSSDLVRHISQELWFSARGFVRAICQKQCFRFFLQTLVKSQLSLLSIGNVYRSSSSTNDLTRGPRNRCYETVSGMKDRSLQRFFWATNASLPGITHLSLFSRSWFRSRRLNSCSSSQGTELSSEPSRFYLDLLHRRSPSQC